MKTDFAFSHKMVIFSRHIFSVTPSSCNNKTNPSELSLTVQEKMTMWNVKGVAHVDEPPQSPAVFLHQIIVYCFGSRSLLSSS